MSTWHHKLNYEIKCNSLSHHILNNTVHHIVTLTLLSITDSYLWSSVQIEGQGLSPAENRPHLLPGLGVVTIEQEATHDAVTGHCRHLRLEEHTHTHKTQFC